MTANTSQNDLMIPSLNEIIRLLWRHKFILIIATLLPLFLAGTYIKSLPNLYSSNASIVIEDSELKMANFKDVTSGREFDTLTIQTQAQLLRSPAMALRTIEKLNLEGNKTFMNTLDLPVGMDKKAKSYAVLRAFQDNLKVTPFPTSRVIDLTFVSRDPALAANILNTHIDLYIQSQLDAKKERATKLADWIDTQVIEFKKQVSEKSADIARFRAQNGLALGENSEELIYQQISDIAGQLVPVEVKKMEMQARLRGLNAAGGEGVAEVVGSPLIQSLKTQQNISQQKVEALRAEYGPNHPKMIAARSELEQVTQAVNAEIENIRSSVVSEANAVSRQQSMLNARLNRMQNQADSIREKMVTLRGLEVEEAASQKLLDDFLARQEEIKAQTNFATADTKVISTAAPAAKPFAPRKKAMFAAALLASLFFGFAAVFIRTLFETGIKNFADIKKMNVTPLGILPKVGRDRTYKAILYGGESSYKESVKRIYMNGIMGAQAKTVMISSPLPKAGKTDFTLSLANYLISIGQKVLVIDTDFFAPEIHNRAGVNLEPGFADVARGGISINQAIQTNDDGVAILSAGSRSNYSPANLKADTFSALLGSLSSVYDYILIDTGPMLARAEAGIIAGQVDGVILLTNWMKTPTKTVQKAADLVTNTGGTLLGLVLNKVNISKYKAYNAESDFLLPKYRGSNQNNRRAA